MAQPRVLYSCSVYMRLALIFLLVMISATISMGQDVLSSLEWEKRVVIISSEDSTYALDFEKGLTADLKKLNDYKLVVLRRANDHVMHKVIEPTITYSLPKKVAKELDRTADGQIFLIGLDGGIKYTSTELISAEDIFDLIDSMPMRKMEKRND